MISTNRVSGDVPLFKGLMSAALAKIAKPEIEYHLPELVAERE